MIYRICAPLDHGDRHYPEGEVVSLEDWEKAHVESALMAGLIEEMKPEAKVEDVVGEPEEPGAGPQGQARNRREEHGESRSEKR
jgi:hypothetical protein